MVCLGNICRSPTAHGVLEKSISVSGLSHLIEVDSAGTGDWHIGENPDARATTAAATRGYDISQQTARQVAAEDFERYHYILAMDRTNLKDLKARCPRAMLPKLQLLLAYGNSTHESVPDPYYSGEEGFELVLDLVEESCSNLLQKIIEDHDLKVGSGQQRN